MSYNINKENIFNMAKLTSKEAIKAWLSSVGITSSYTINNDLSIDMDNDVDLYQCNLTEIPVVFERVNGNFDCSHNALTSLDFLPKEIMGDLEISHNQLKNLKGISSSISKNLFCNSNPLETLEYFPDYIGHKVVLKKLNLTNLIGMENSQIKGSIIIEHNPLLTSVEGLPEVCKSSLIIRKCALTSLVHCSKEVGNHFDCSHNNLVNLEGAPEKVNADFACSDNPLTTINLTTQGIKTLYIHNSGINSIDDINIAHLEQLRQLNVDEINRIKGLESLYKITNFGNNEVSELTISYENYLAAKEKYGLAKVVKEVNKSNQKLKV